MKKIIILLSSLILTQVAESQNKVRIFNTDLSIKEILGTTFITTDSIRRNLPKVLVKNNDYYTETIGTFRPNFASLEPTGLFNMVDRGSYPLLDSINMAYYDEVVIPKLMSDTSVTNLKGFWNFKEDWDSIKGRKIIAQRKALLYKKDYIKIGIKIQQGRFNIITAPFSFSAKTSKKLSATVSSDIKAALKNINITHSAYNALTRVVNSSISYSGRMSFQKV
jgi:hypothetical protein